MTEVKERPILFSAPMVRAILEGRKTQTRRIVRKQFAPDAAVAEIPATHPSGWQISGHSGLWWDDDASCIDDAVCCPFGVPGNQLWVRETWQGPLLDYDVAESIRDWRSFQKPQFCKYAADGGPAPEFLNEDEELVCRWRPSIHMPRWASRIALEVTRVRVERLQDISESDAQAEGITPYQNHPGRFLSEHRDGLNFPSAKAAFRDLWESISSPESWNANPWVWVIEFKRMEVPA